MEKELRTGEKYYRGFVINESSIIFKSSKGYDLMIKDNDDNGLLLWNIDLNEYKKMSYKTFNEMFPDFQKEIENKIEEVLNKKKKNYKEIEDKKSIIKKDIIDSYLNKNNHKLEI